jgi:hypothetical protein
VGTVNVEIVALDNQTSTLVNGLVYNYSNPVITKVVNYEDTGERPVAFEIHGTGFQVGAQVSIGGVSALQLEYVNFPNGPRYDASTDLQIWGMIPREVPVSVCAGADVVVTNPSTGASGTKVCGWIWLPLRNS